MACRCKVVERNIGVPICGGCNFFLIYGSSGKKRLLKHAVQCKKKKKKENKITNAKNHTFDMSVRCSCNC